MIHAQHALPWRPYPFPTPSECGWVDGHSPLQGNCATDRRKVEIDTGPPAAAGVRHSLIHSFNSGKGRADGVGRYGGIPLPLFHFLESGLTVPMDHRPGFLSGFALFFLARGEEEEKEWDRQAVARSVLLCACLLRFNNMTSAVYLLCSTVVGHHFTALTATNFPSRRLLISFVGLLACSVPFRLRSYVLSFLGQLSQCNAHLCRTGPMCQDEASCQRRNSGEVSWKRLGSLLELRKTRTQRRCDNPHSFKLLLSEAIGQKKERRKPGAGRGPGSGDDAPWTQAFSRFHDATPRW